MSKLANVLLFVACVALAGCSKPYAVPQLVEPGEGQPAAAFPGLETLLSQQSSASGARPRLRVLWTHGMCTHDRKWVDNRIQALSTAAVGPTATSRGAAAAPAAEIVQRTIDIPAGIIDASFVIWSPLTASYKQNLSYDSGGEGSSSFERSRVAVNDLLKSKLMDDCLLDAVVYLGESGDPIRATMLEAVCSALGGQYAAATRCTLAANVETVPTVFVTESLGSKFLFDAVRQLVSDFSARSPAQRAVLANQLAAARALFMLSNQVPLLDQSSPVRLDVRGTGRPHGGLPEFLEAIGAARTAVAAGDAGLRAALEREPFAVVSFTDPNDILSYRLTRAHVGENKVRLINVITSNAWGYLGQLANPLRAHCGYGENPFVIGLVLKGHRGPGTELPRAAVVPGSSCGD